ncbi:MULTISPECIES: peptidylprolyl isomerase [Paenibacillus]|uniref:peptidylprolyl isomerase n=1 Tax=Paenibacillus TaxID=44249 RepID=UPI002FDF35F1
MFRNKGRSWKTPLLALTLVMALAIVAGCGSNVVATYEGGKITAKEFDLEQRILLAVSDPMTQQFMQMDEYKEYLLKQQIAYKYLAAKADSKFKETGKTKGTEAFNNMKSYYGDAKFKEMLSSQKVTEDDIKNYMIRYYTVLETQSVKVTDADVKKEFEATKEDYITASVRHILIGFKDAEGKEVKKEDALKLANEIKSRLEKGEDFAELAKKYSTDPGSKDNGGLYADYPLSGWVPEFKEKAMTLPLNTISEPVETSFGYHIMRVEKRTEKKFEDLTANEKDLIKLAAASQKLDEFMAGDLEKKIIKKINLPKTEKKEDSGTTNPATGGNAGQSGNGAGGNSTGTGTGGNAETGGK